MRIAAAGRSDVGKVRTENEDAYGVYPDLGLFIVADGLGGHAGGEVASRLAVDEMHRVVRAGYSPSTSPSPPHPSPLPPGEREQFAALPDAAKRLVAALMAANQAVLKAAGEQSRLTGMGTTVVAMLIEGSPAAPALAPAAPLTMTAHLAHVGDSRAYLIRPGPEARLLQLTEDHSVVNEYVAQGLMSREAAEASSSRHELSRAVGLTPTVEVDVRTVSLKAGDRLLLCSDGLTTMLNADEILRATRSAPDPEAACAALVTQANDRGGEDNITAVVIAVGAG